MHPFPHLIASEGPVQPIRPHYSMCFTTLAYGSIQAHRSVSNSNSFDSNSDPVATNCKAMLTLSFPGCGSFRMRTDSRAAEAHVGPAGVPKHRDRACMQHAGRPLLLPSARTNRWRVFRKGPWERGPLGSQSPLHEAVHGTSRGRKPRLLVSWFVKLLWHSVYGQLL